MGDAALIQNSLVTASWDKQNEGKLETQSDQTNQVDIDQDEEGQEGEVYIKENLYFLAEKLMPVDTKAICPWPVEDTGDERSLRSMPFLNTTFKIWELPEFSCGSRVWDSAIVLAKYLENLPAFRSNAQGKRVMELGTGTGLLGIACWYLGCDVTITDYDESVLFLPRENLALNGIKNERMNVATLLWGDDCGELKPPFDYIVGSDLVYDPSSFPSLRKCVSDLSDERTEIIFCNHRRRGEQSIFLMEMEKEFKVELLPLEGMEKVLPEGYPLNNLFVYRFTKKRCQKEE